MKIKTTLISLMCLASLTAMAKPARVGASYQMQQSDGSTVALSIVGDEFHHYYLTSDDQVVVSYGSDYYYATVDAADNLVITSILAHNPAQRGADEMAFVSTLNPDKVKASMLNRHDNIMRANSQDGKGNIGGAFPKSGNVKSLVFLVAFADVPFVTDNAGDYFSRLLNEENFKDNGGSGSCRDYYLDASMGVFDPSFDVYGPVTLPNNRAYYGANGTNGADVRPREMMLHAAQLLDEQINFKDYDLDGDNFVDNVYIFYSGQSEADGGGADCVWPHQSSVGISSKYRFDGVQLNRYACGSELSGDKPDGIGTFCHEFGHVLGLPDLYNVNDMSVNYTPLNYSLMDQGCYNNGGTLPPTLSSFERNALGWMGDNLMEINEPMTISIDNLADTNVAYLINTDQPNEFFLFENRQQKGWDAGLPGHGMLIWHIDYDRTTFVRNNANADRNHQRVDLIEANNRNSFSFITMARYPFPGASKVTSYTYDTTPSFRAWSGYDMRLPITDIKEEDGIITFKVAGGAGISDALISSKLDCRVLGRAISVEADGNIVITDISGRVMASGCDSLSATMAAPGIYIVSAAAGTQKVMIK